MRYRPLLSELGGGKLPDSGERQTLETLQKTMQNVPSKFLHLKCLNQPHRIRVVFRIFKVNSWVRLTPPSLGNLYAELLQTKGLDMVGLLRGFYSSPQICQGIDVCSVPDAAVQYQPGKHAWYMSVRGKV